MSKDMEKMRGAVSLSKRVIVSVEVVVGLKWIECDGKGRDNLDHVVLPS